ncbi:general stress protein [Leucobacter sp. G161]|uniref:general stress protein n=1 Tax=Leucobacter sp. G161 TaxID=663704 RepID=UPI00073B97B9|nr:general stress protein [Leucobacter sp. G161]KUF08259.1 hypothetical protein AUL38_05960 [Leucobacter sp. G161]
MSTPGFPNSRAPIQPEIPKGEIISTYDRYEDAKHAVDVLARSGFPVQRVSILGNDLRSVERVTGRLSYGKIAWMGALSGAYLGLFLGLLLFIFQPDNAGIGGVFLSAIVIGAGFGMLFGLLSYALNRNRRDFSSVMQMVATRYDLVTEDELLHEARRLLTGDAPQQ